MKKILHLVLAALFLAVLVGCSPTSQQLQPQLLSDSRLDGNFSYYKSMEGMYDNDGYWFEYLTFNGTNQYTQYVKYWYWSGSRWVISGNSKGDHYYFVKEIEINTAKTQYRTRLWDNEYSSWSEWADYKFLNNGNTLRLYSPGTEFYTDYSKK